MKKLLFLTTALLFISTISSAYPITPRPLRKLVIESEIIIQGKVIKIGSEKQKGKDYEWESDYALILVQEILQGSVEKDTIKVYYTAGLICPAPAQYIEGEVAIIFLDRIKEKKRRGYTTHALSYGVKNYLPEEGLYTYKKRIREMQEILKMAKGPKQDQLTMEWLVNCAIDKYTRWEGVYELSPGSNFMSYYDRDGVTNKESFLTKDQRKRIFDALLKTDTLNYSDMGLVDMVIGIDDKVLLEHLKKGLSLIDQNYLWPASAIMERIVFLTGDIELESLLKKFDGSSFSYKEEDKKKTKAVYTEFVQKMKAAGLKKVIYASGNSST